MNRIIARQVLLLILVLPVLFSGCKAMRESVKARAMLGKCTYQLKSVDLSVLDFAPTVTFDNGSKKINIERPSTVEVIAVLNEIRKKEFKLEVKELSFNAIVEISNPNSSEAIMDSIFVETYLDDMYAMRVLHKEHSIIPAKGKDDTKLTLEIPLSISLDKVLSAEEVKLNGKVWLKMKVTKNRTITLPVPIKLKTKIPREEIKAEIAKQEEIVVTKLVEVAKAKKVDKDLKKATKSMFGF